MTPAERRAEAEKLIEGALAGLKLANGGEMVGRVLHRHYVNASRSLKRAGELLDPDTWDEVES